MLFKGVARQLNAENRHGSPEEVLRQTSLAIPDKRV
jgi:hypothetical protein